MRVETISKETLPLLRVIGLSSDECTTRQVQQLKFRLQRSSGAHVEVRLPEQYGSASRWGRSTALWRLLLNAIDGIPTIVLRGCQKPEQTGWDRAELWVVGLLGFQVSHDAMRRESCGESTCLQRRLAPTAAAESTSVPSAFLLKTKLTGFLAPCVVRNLKRLQKMVHASKNPLSRRALMHGVGLATEHLEVLRVVRAGTVLDVGANCGQFAISARVANTETRIVSFEPLPRPSRLFQRVFEGSRDIDLRTTALGSSPGMQQIHVSSSDDSSSLLRIGSRQVEEFPGTEMAEIQQVAVSTLDQELAGNSLPGPVLLKLDVQGYELEVLHGGEETLSRIDYIYCEVSFLEFYDEQPLAKTVMDFLVDAGFTIKRVGEVTRSRQGEVLQADLLFERR